MDKVFAGKPGEKLGFLSTYLGKKDFLLGELTVVDFLFAEFLESLSLLNPELYKKHENFAGYVERFLAIP